MIGRLIMALRVFAVLAVALAAGHLVQTLRPEPLTMTAVAGSPPAVPEATLPQLAGITTVSATTSGTTAACDMRLALAQAPAATIDLTLAAPCHSGERVVIRHAGLAFSETLGADGRLRLQFPALTQDALVAAYVGSSEIVLGQIEIAEVVDFLRLAVQMPAPALFDLRADEGGQVYVARATGPDGEIQKITALGETRMESPLLSQVYSVAIRDLVAPELSVELRITPEICGRTLAADIFLSRHGAVTQSSRKVAVPLCGTSGDILLLKNLLPDLTLVSPN